MLQMAARYQQDIWRQGSSNKVTETCMKVKQDSVIRGFLFFLKIWWCEIYRNSPSQVQHTQMFSSSTCNQIQATWIAECRCLVALWQYLTPQTAYTAVETHYTPALECLSLSPHWPNLASSDYLVSVALKEEMGGKTFRPEEEVQQAGKSGCTLHQKNLHYVSL